MPHTVVIHQRYKYIEVVSKLIYTDTCLNNNSTLTGRLQLLGVSTLAISSRLILVIKKEEVKTKCLY